MSALVDEGTDARTRVQRREPGLPGRHAPSGLVAHLAFDPAVAVVTEAQWAVLRRRP